ALDLARRAPGDGADVAPARVARLRRRGARRGRSRSGLRGRRRLGLLVAAAAEAAAAALPAAALPALGAPLLLLLLPLVELGLLLGGQERAHVTAQLRLDRLH